MSDYNMVYRTELSVTVGSADVVDDGDGAFHKDFALPAPIKLGSAFLTQACRYRRIGDEYGATVRLFDEETLRMAWYGSPDETEGLLNDESTGLDEIITVAVEVFDLEEMGDELKEILFQGLRVLGYLGENVMQDLLDYDDAGNLVTYRLRVFDTRANCEAATPELPDGQALQTGELARVTMNQDIVPDRNDRELLTRVLTDVLATPGVDVEE